MNQGLRCGSFPTAAAAAAAAAVAWRPSDALSALVYLRQVPCASAAAALEVIKPCAPHVHSAVITPHPRTKNQYPL